MPIKKGKIVPPSYDDDRIVADKVTDVVGSGKFIVIQSIVLIVYLLWNTMMPKGLRFDPYTFTLLNLVLSFQAAYTGPFVIWSQNRSVVRDRQVIAFIRDMVHSIKQDEDKNRRLEAKMEKEIKTLNESNKALNDKLDLALSLLQEAKK